jgi:uncharacterized membrane protein required for colicin V production
MFLGLTVLDWLLVLLFISYAVTGWRQGLVVSVLSLAGFLGGGALAMWLLPKAIHDWTNLEGSRLMRAIVLIAGVFIVASIGQALTVQLGGKLRSRLHLRPVRALDAAAGAVAVVLSAAVLVWFIAGALRGGAPAPLAKAIGESRVLRTIDEVVPPQTSRLFAGFREVLDREGFPRVFEGIGTERIAPVAPPDANVVASPGVREAANSVINQHQVVPQPLTPTLQRTGQRVQRRRQLARLHRPQQRQQVRKHRLQLDRHTRPVLTDHIPRPQVSPRHHHRTTRRRRDQIDEPLPEQRLGQQPRPHPRRDEVHLPRVQRQPQPGPLGRHRDRGHLTDDHPAQLHIRAPLQLRTDPVGQQRHVHRAGEPALEHRHRQPDQQRHHHQEHHPVGMVGQPGQEALGGPHRPCGRRLWFGHGQPAIRTVVVAPHTAREKKKSTMLMATMEVRTALPTATPTPAGPPEAV